MNRAVITITESADEIEIELDFYPPFLKKEKNPATHYAAMLALKAIKEAMAEPIVECKNCFCDECPDSCPKGRKTTMKCEKCGKEKACYHTGTNETAWVCENCGIPAEEPIDFEAHAAITMGK